MIGVPRASRATRCQLSDRHASRPYNAVMGASHSRRTYTALIPYLLSSTAAIRRRKRSGRRYPYNLAHFSMKPYLMPWSILINPAGEMKTKEARHKTPRCPGGSGSLASSHRGFGLFPHMHPWSLHAACCSSSPTVRPLRDARVPQALKIEGQFLEPHSMYADHAYGQWRVPMDVRLPPLVDIRE